MGDVPLYLPKSIQALVPVSRAALLEGASLTLGWQKAEPNDGVYLPIFETPAVREDNSLARPLVLAPDADLDPARYGVVAAGGRVLFYLDFGTDLAMRRGETLTAYFPVDLFDAWMAAVGDRF